MSRVSVREECARGWLKKLSGVSELVNDTWSKERRTHLGMLQVSQTAKRPYQAMSTGSRNVLQTSETSMSSK